MEVASWQQYEYYYYIYLLLLLLYINFIDKVYILGTEPEMAPITVYDLKTGLLNVP